MTSLSAPDSADRRWFATDGTKFLRDDGTWQAASGSGTTQRTFTIFGG